MSPQTKSRIVAAIAFPLLILSGTPVRAATAPAAVNAPTRFSVVVEGHGPDVILIPGLSSTREVYADVAAHLKAGHRVHLVQIKGFGEPAGPNASGPVLAPVADEIAAYAARLGHPAIVGHSMGGLIALKIAADHPALPSKVVVVDSLPFIGTLFGADSVDALRPQAEAMRAALAKAPAPDFAAKPDCEHAASNPLAVRMSLSPAGRCIVAHGQAVSDPRVTGQAMVDDMTTDLRSRVAAIKAPVTLLYPRGGPVPSAMADALYAAAYKDVAGARLEPIDGSAHFIMQDQPAAFAAALDAALAR